QHGAGGKLAGIQHGIEVTHPERRRRLGFAPPPGQIVIAAAQIDDGADAALLQEGSRAAGPGLGGARRFARHHPMEIVENVSCRAHYAGIIAGLPKGQQRQALEKSMRISKAALMSRWAWSTGAAALVFAVLWVLDLRLKALAGVGTADIQSFATAAQF